MELNEALRLYTELLELVRVLLERYAEGLGGDTDEYVMI